MMITEATPRFQAAQTDHDGGGIGAGESALGFSAAAFSPDAGAAFLRFGLRFFDFMENQF